MPAYAKGAREYFYVYNATKAYLPIKDSKLIRGSATLAGSIEIAEMLELAEEDLSDEDIKFKIKPLQTLESVQNTVMVGIPKDIPASLVEMGMKSALRELNRGERPEFTVVQSYPPGMPYDENEAKKRRAGQGKFKLTFNIHVGTKDEARLDSLLDHAKKRGLWNRIWGKCSFSLKVPDELDSESEKEN